MTSLLPKVLLRALPPLGCQAVSSVSVQAPCKGGRYAAVVTTGGGRRVHAVAVPRVAAAPQREGGGRPKLTSAQRPEVPRRRRGRDACHRPSVRRRLGRAGETLDTGEQYTSQQPFYHVRGAHTLCFLAYFAERVDIY